MNFKPVHEAMQSYVDGNILAGVSQAVLRGQEVVDLHCVGWADKENAIALRSDHLFRVFSNTKLVTTIAVMLLVERGKLKLDDPVEAFIPQLGQRQVLRAGAKTLDDSVPATQAITIRQLLSHSSGLSYGLLDPGTTIFKAYVAGKVLSPATDLADMMNRLKSLPVVFQPGTGWEYSVATDVLGRLVEIVSEMRLDQFFDANIFAPLGMTDTSFCVPAEKQGRLTTIYSGADLMKPTLPGLTRAENYPYPGAYLNPVARLSGGGGLVSSLGDMVSLLRSLLPGGPVLLQRHSIDTMMSNQLPSGTSIRFPLLGDIKGKVFGLGGAITVAASAIDPVGSEGEFQWGGIAGTHWWINPRTQCAGVLMTQRVMSFWNPFSFDIKRRVYAALAGTPQ